MSISLFEVLYLGLERGDPDPTHSLRFFHDHGTFRYLKVP